jgi:protein-S-isoprenylcysteine O-methyltransferase Ste14
MKTNTIPQPAAPQPSFFNQLIQEAPQKMGGLLVALLLYYIAPLAGQFPLIFTPQVAIALLACTLVYLVQPAADPAQTKSKKDKNSMLYLIVATTISQAAIVVEWAYFQPTHVWTYNAITITGLVLIVLGLWVRTAAIYALRVHFNNAIVIKDGHELIQTGTYKYIRHGSYTGAIAVGLGIGLVFESWWGFLISVVVLGLAYGYRIWHEEKVLLAHFGDKYRVYQKKTWMLIPFIL